MNYWRSFVKGGEESQASGAEIVSRLCDRVASSTLLEDRRNAVRSLKSLSRKFRKEVGSQGMTHIVGVLAQDSTDDEIVAYALDTLSHLMSSEPDDENSIPQPELVQSFIDEFTADDKNVSLILDFIERPDFATRLAAVRLLISLLKGQTSRMQEIIITHPMGVSHLIDLLTDGNEVIRNEALLLLIELTRANANIQKIVAFENGFDMVLGIIHTEGLSDGGIIVEDCLTLLLHLLTRNTSNQQFFKEGSFVQRLTPFFEIDSESVWSAQKVANLHLMIKVVRTLVSPSNPSNVTSACQLAMQQSGMLERLCGMLMATGVPADILTETINAVSEVIRGCAANQNMFDSVYAPCEPPRPAIVVLLMSMVNDNQPFELRCAVLYCFQCFLHSNPIGQAKIVSTLLPSSFQPQEISSGQLLCGGLFAASDPLSNWCSAVALSHALYKNVEMKQQLLRVQLATSVGNPPISLMQQITNIVTQSVNLQSKMGLLILLCSWLTECPVAVSHFLNDSGSVPFLLGQIAEHGNEQDHILHGVCALLLGICIKDNDGSVPERTKEYLIELIVARVGVERFCDTLDAVTKHDLYSKAFQRSQPVAPTASDMLFDHTFTKLFKNLEDKVIKLVSNLEDVKKEEESKAAIEAHDSIIKEYQSLIRTQDAELKDLKSKVGTMQTELASTKEQLEERTAQCQQLKDQYNVLKIMNESAGDGDASNIVATLHSEIQDLKKQNDEYVHKITEKDTEIQQLRNDLDSLERRSLELSFSDESQQNRKTPENVNATDDTIAALSSVNVPDDSRLQDSKITQLTAEVERLKIQLDAKDEELRSSQTTRLAQTAESGSDDAYDALVAEKTVMQTKMHELENTIAQNIFEKQNLTTEIDSLKKSVIDLQQKESSLFLQLENATSDTKKAQEQLNAEQKEQEDLMLLMSDQEAKINKYREKVKNLGGEISEEEDDEDEDEDLESEDGEDTDEQQQPNDLDSVAADSGE